MTVTEVSQSENSFLFYFLCNVRYNPVRWHFESLIQPCGYVMLTVASHFYSELAFKISEVLIHFN